MDLVQKLVFWCFAASLCLSGVDQKLVKGCLASKQCVTWTNTLKHLTSYQCFLMWAQNCWFYYQSKLPPKNPM